MLMNSLNINPKYASIIEKYLTGKGDEDENKRKNFDSHNIDRFGVFHPEGLHPEEESEEEKQRFARRLGKWRDMTANLTHEHSPWTKLFNEGHPSERLVRRTFKGIPAQFRMIVWPMYLFVPRLKRENPDVYSRMLNLALATSDDLGQIDLDIMRTFRNTTYFCDRFGPRQQALFRILAAYSVYNKEVGYCQGMSELVGMLLTYIIEDEDAFWAFSQLMIGPKHQLHCVFKAGFPGLTRQLSHHEVIVKKLLPSLSKHFAKMQLNTSCYALKWFMQCFMDRLPLSLVLRLWDVYLLEGECILFAMAYNILKLHKKRLLQMDEHQILSFFQDELPKDFKYNDDLAIESLKDCLEQLQRNHLARPAPPDKDMLPQSPMGQTSSGIFSTGGSSLYLNRASASGTNVRAPTSTSVPSGYSRQSSATTDSTTQISGAHGSQGLATSAAILTMSAMSKHRSAAPTTTTTTGYSGSSGRSSVQRSRILHPERLEDQSRPKLNAVLSPGLCYSVGGAQQPAQYRFLPTYPRSSAAGRSAIVVPSTAAPRQLNVNSHHSAHQPPTTNSAQHEGHLISIGPSEQSVVDVLNPAGRPREVQRNHQVVRISHSGGDQSSSRSLLDRKPNHQSTSKDDHLQYANYNNMSSAVQRTPSGQRDDGSPPSGNGHGTLRPAATPPVGAKPPQSVRVVSTALPATTGAVRVVRYRSPSDRSDGATQRGASVVSSQSTRVGQR